MLIDKIKAAILIHRELGIGYFQLLRGYLKKDKIVTVRIKNLAFNMEIWKTSALAKILKNGWEIISVSNNFIIYENKQKGIKLYSVIDDYFLHLQIIEEVFIQELYKSDFKNKAVIDIGAYLGESAIYFAINGAKKVIALEPDEDFYKLALMNIKENGLEDKIILLNKALAPKEGVINFYKYLSSPICSTTDPNNRPKVDGKTIVKQVETITLDQVVKIIGTEERIGLLKLDCEGCEYSVLNSFSNLNLIDNIILEYHNGLQNLPNLLKDHEFEIYREKGDEKVGIIKAFKK